MQGNLRKHLRQNKDLYIKEWFQLIVSTYPDDTSKFLIREKDRFQNPVGFTIREGIMQIFDEVAGNMDHEKLVKSLETIIKIRSVQDFSPSEAVRFVMMFKRVIYAHEHDWYSEGSYHEDVHELEERIEVLLMQSFDIYMRCREKIFEVKALETKNTTYKLLERMNKLYGADQDKPRSNDT